jgi:hypothetical protein
MKSISYAALVLSVLMVAATVDDIPDPPAVPPHTVTVKASCQREFVGSFREQGLTCASACISPHVPIHRVGLADANEPKRSSNWIRLTAFATDPSPPVL